MKKSIIFAIIIMFSAVLYAGPFGCEMGWKAADYEKSGIEITLSKKFNGYSSYTINPINKHPKLESYVVFIDDELGTFSIKASTGIIEASSFGTQVKNVFSELESQISDSYGESETLDILLPGSIWDEPNYWMMGLYKGERYLMAMWTNVDNSSIDSIGMMTRALSTSSAAILLEYSSPDAETISDRARAANASVF